MGIRIPFCPRSQGFYAQRFSTTVFTDLEVCDAIQCISANSAFFNSVLATETTCATVQGGPCPGNTATLEACATFIRGLLTNAGADAVLTTFCGVGFPSALNSIFRQYLTNLLNICISTTVQPFGCVGGVLEEYRVNLTDAQRAALGFAAGQCVTVADILALAESALSSCGAVSFDLAILATVLGDMAQDAGTTIIVPAFC
ncbi:hypothetical protein [Neobacillus sp. 19]|uniref:hypothetical protein n=1 Tax=Neobacillus sp. 19 TaxID=3394458 RepID=UPI003BF66463